MLATLITAALAITGTLAGAIVSGRFQERAAERQARIAHGESVRRDRLEAVTTLACAASDHRRAMWMRGDALLKGAGPEQVETLRAESHLTRSAITRPLVALRVLIEDQAVRAAADAMVTLTYAMRDASATTDDLAAAREAAKAAHDDFVSAAARYLSPTVSRGAL
ncbi:hypothetical protein QQY24_34405 [Streptomyces sp. TG1A-8]|uniref:hypothetical protein n=1 Tax=Streptomyces sp. TG1A-8 TaxID=3051385 RepID=UPI00265C0BA8|nr:hypothetical protein [Streptomyces sp. TG1A-8]MDO0930152.1 hypothetical protein [Streptomyces sp. TG1A-8]